MPRRAAMTCLGPLRAAAEFTRIHQPKRRLEPKDESENRSLEPTEAGESPPEAGEAQSAPPERRQTAAQVPPAGPTAPPESATISDGAMARTKKKKANCPTTRLREPGRRRHHQPPRQVARQAARCHRRWNRPGERGHRALCLDALGSMLRTTAQRSGTWCQRRDWI